MTKKQYYFYWCGMSDIDENQPQLCWAHILRNVAAIKDSVVERNIGYTLEKGSFSGVGVFSEFGINMKQRGGPQTQYYQRINRLRRSWNETLKKEAIN